MFLSFEFEFESASQNRNKVSACPYFYSVSACDGGLVNDR